jgi:hypothetical protein
MSALLRLISVVCSLILLMSFAMFAADQARHGSKTTVAKIAAGDDTTGTVTQQQPVKPKPKQHNEFRRAVDGANEKLVSPFNGVVGTSSGWSRHITLLILGFLVFGVGIGFVARYVSTRGL